MEPLFINGIQINQVLDTSFLGVIIDQNITWKPQINYVATKISKLICVLYKSSFFLPQNILISLYYALIYPYLHYCNVVWASTYPTKLRRLMLLQKRYVRIIITKANICAPSDPIFNELTF